MFLIMKEINDHGRNSDNIEKHSEETKTYY